jgi:hypothetical protein
MRLKAGLVCVAAVAAFAVVVAAPAGAVVMKTPNGPVGYLPLNGQGPRVASGKDSNGNLDYHGGPVMPSNKQFAIFWAPPGYAFPAGYESGIVRYMKDVARDSGFPTNVYSVGTQYFDAAGNTAAYKSSFGGSFDDTTPYPSSENCPPYSTDPSDPNANSFSVCVSDKNLSDEVDNVVSLHGLPRGLTNQYFVFLPDGVGSCIPDNSSSDGWACFDREFCAYHSSNGTGGETLYANESFTPIDPLGCGAGGNYPNGGQPNSIDDELSSLSHEANETITDPLGTGWYNDNNGQENGDQCRNTLDDFGPLLGGTLGVNGFNQIIGGRHYILQQEWSNAVNGCEQYYHLGGTQFLPKRARVGQTVRLAVRIQDLEGGRVTNIKWSFGDGRDAVGKNVSHTYRRTGKFRITILVTNSTGLHLVGGGKIKIKPQSSRRIHQHVAAAKLTVR